eukprot:m.114029 g.114029  ORF g.114029 m.114029 type:complete len:1009 (-) comp10824_c1_seq1:124-3150(-)
MGCSSSKERDASPAAEPPHAKDGGRTSRMSNGSRSSRTGTHRTSSRQGSVLHRRSTPSQVPWRRSKEGGMGVGAAESHTRSVTPSGDNAADPGAVAHASPLAHPAVSPVAELDEVDICVNDLPSPARQTLAPPSAANNVNTTTHTARVASPGDGGHTTSTAAPRTPASQSPMSPRPILSPKPAGLAVSSTPAHTGHRSPNRDAGVPQSNQPPTPSLDDSFADAVPEEQESPCKSPVAPHKTMACNDESEDGIVDMTEPVMEEAPSPVKDVVVVVSCATPNQTDTADAQPETTTSVSPRTSALPHSPHTPQSPRSPAATVSSSSSPKPALPPKPTLSPAPPGRSSAGSTPRRSIKERLNRLVSRRRSSERPASSESATAGNVSSTVSNGHVISPAPPPSIAIEEPPSEPGSPNGTEATAVSSSSSSAGRSSAGTGKIMSAAGGAARSSASSSSGARTSEIGVDGSMDNTTNNNTNTNRSSLTSPSSSHGGGALVAKSGGSPGNTPRGSPKLSRRPTSHVSLTGGIVTTFPADLESESPPLPEVPVVVPEWKRDLLARRRSSAAAAASASSAVNGPQGGSSNGGGGVSPSKSSSLGPAGISMPQDNRPASMSPSSVPSPTVKPIEATNVVGMDVDGAPVADGAEAEEEAEVLTVEEEIPVTRSSLLSIKRWSRPRDSLTSPSTPLKAEGEDRASLVLDVDSLGPAEKEVPMPVLKVCRTRSRDAIQPGESAASRSPLPSRASAASVFGAKLKAPSARTSSASTSLGPRLSGHIPRISTSSVMDRRPLGAVTVAEYDAGLPADDGYETVAERAVDAARSMDGYIRTLIEVIQTHGKKPAMEQGGDTAAAPLSIVTFGQLFEHTANVFDSLVGIIKTARKYGVVACDKDQLWQGQDDDEEIALLKAEHDGIYIPRRRLSQVERLQARSSAQSGGFRKSSLMTENQKCEACKKRVYAQEFVGANDKAYHKGCFRCADCDRVLKSTDYCNTRGLNYCPSCFNRLVMAVGGAGKE